LLSSLEFLYFESFIFGKYFHFVIPTKAGIRKALKILDSSLHGNDKGINLR
jgi:hypothetical protein